MQLDPVTGVPPIPAMTSEAERLCYYRLACEAEGAVIEFGTWLGAATAYLAAAMRDSGAPGKVHTYDKFVTKKSHGKLVRKFRMEQGEDPSIEHANAYQHFLANIGPLVHHVTVNPGRIEAQKWSEDPIGLIVFDAPKRVPAISAVLTNFRNGIVPGTMMAWQDFCHFPSYEIPACLYRLRDHLEFTEAVVPGSTLCFRVKSVWEPGDVSVDALSLRRWSTSDIEEAWDYWLQFVPAEKAALFTCGMAMFNSDIGSGAAVSYLQGILEHDAAAVLPKWDYLRQARPDFVVRYRLLFDCVAAERQAA